MWIDANTEVLGDAMYLEHNDDEFDIGPNFHFLCRKAWQKRRRKLPKAKKDKLIYKVKKNVKDSIPIKRSIADAIVSSAYPSNSNNNYWVRIAADSTSAPSSSSPPPVDHVAASMLAKSNISLVPPSKCKNISATNINITTNSTSPPASTSPPDAPDRVPRVTPSSQTTGIHGATTTLSPLVATHTSSPQRSHQPSFNNIINSNRGASSTPSRQQPLDNIPMPKKLTPKTQLAVDYLMSQNTNDPVLVLDKILADPKIANSPSTIQSIFTLVKKALRKVNPFFRPAEKQKSDEGIDDNAFYFHGPNCKPKILRGLHRSMGQDNNPTYNIHENAMKAKRTAVQRCVESGDDDQIALALRETLFHPKIRQYSARVFGDVFSEESRVGRRLVRGMRDITDKVATNKNKGMLSRMCRSLLSTLLMCFGNEDDGDVSKAAVGRQILGAYFVVNKGDWYCEGEWLEKLKGARGWWTLTGTRCIVRLETVIMSDVRLLEKSSENPLPTRLTRYFTSKEVEQASTHGAWRLSDIDHADIIESSHDLSYLEYDEDLVKDFREELVSDLWADNENVNSDDE